MPIYYVTRKDMTITKDREKRDVQIIYQASLVVIFFNIDSFKVLYMIKEPTLGDDAGT